MNILVVLAHPRSDSFNAALAEAYRRGSKESGAEVAFLDLATLRFDRDVTHPSPLQQELEPDLREAHEAIDAADHVVFVFPTWWVTMPALLKGFLDRILLPGWAFREDDDSPTGYRPLLGGRSAHLVTTMDTPGWAHRWIYGRPGMKAMKRGILGFCGFKPVTDTWITGVKEMSAEERENAIDQVYREGQQAPSRRRRQLRRKKIMAWVKIARLHFYGMTLLAYGLGAAAAVNFAGVAFSLPVFSAGFLAIFLMELGSVLLNEFHDQATDRANRRYGPFNGGSRVLADGELAPEKVRRVARSVVLLSAILSMTVILVVGRGMDPEWILSATLLFATGFVLGPGYTAPPLRLVYRGAGEIVVAYTHSLFMVLCGWLLMGGDLLATIPWILSLPMFFSVLAAIALAGIPDADADASVNKRTLAVLLGCRGVSWFAAGVVLLCLSAAFFLLPTLPGTRNLLGGFSSTILAHAVVQIILLGRYLRKGAGCRKIDGILFCALSFILWFSLGPLAVLLF